MEAIREGYTRVSEILSSLNDFSGINPRVLENKKNIGSEIHKAIELEAGGLCYPISKSAQGYFDSYCKWRDFTAFTIKHTETRLYCDHLKITGCIDALGVSGHAKIPMLIDFKTTAGANVDYWLLQGNFYHYLASVNDYKLQSRFLFVQLDKFGKMPRVHSFEASDVSWRQCLKMYYLYKTGKNVDKKHNDFIQ